MYNAFNSNNKTKSGFCFINGTRSERKSSIRCVVRIINQKNYLHVRATATCKCGKSARCIPVRPIICAGTADQTTIQRNTIRVMIIFPFWIVKLSFSEFKKAYNK